MHGEACAGSASQLEKIRLDTDRHGDTLTIKVRIDRESNWGWDDASLDLDIEVPESAELDIEDGSGDTVLRNLGKVKFEDGSGDVRAEKIASLELVDGSGDVEIDDSGALRLNDGSGDLWVRRSHGDVTVDEDGSGDIDLAGITGSVLVRDDGSGSIYVADVSGDFTGRRRRLGRHRLQKRARQGLGPGRRLKRLGGRRAPRAGALTRAGGRVRRRRRAHGCVTGPICLTSPGWSRDNLPARPAPDGKAQTNLMARFRLEVGYRHRCWPPAPAQRRQLLPSSCRRTGELNPSQLCRFGTGRRRHGRRAGGRPGQPHGGRAAAPDLLERRLPLVAGVHRRARARGGAWCAAIREVSAAIFKVGDGDPTHPRPGQHGGGGGDDQPPHGARPRRRQPLLPGARRADRPSDQRPLVGAAPGRRRLHLGGRRPPPPAAQHPDPLAGRRPAARGRRAHRRDRGGRPLRALLGRPDRRGDRRRDPAVHLLFPQSAAAGRRPGAARQRQGRLGQHHGGGRPLQGRRRHQDGADRDPADPPHRARRDLRRRHPDRHHRAPGPLARLRRARAPGAQPPPAAGRIPACPNR